jgi:hypothetical protein
MQLLKTIPWDKNRECVSKTESIPSMKNIDIGL